MVAPVFPVAGKCPDCGERNLRRRRSTAQAKGQRYTTPEVTVLTICWCCGSQHEEIMRLEPGQIGKEKLPDDF